MGFPVHRLRRLRDRKEIRSMVRETHLRAGDFIEPFFAVAKKRARREIGSMPGQFQLGLEDLVKECADSKELGIGAVILFGIPEKKDEKGTEGYSRDGVVPRAIRALRKEIPDLYIIADVCLCEYTSHGHCGVVRGGRLQNDPTLDLLARCAVAYADAGADMVAPSAMADGQVRAIREGLDAAGHGEVPILAYAAKYASAFYGPFRQAAESAPAFGDRRGYQMDPSNRREALREVALDIEEGADMVMVKPALAYLDVVREVRRRWDLPVAAYNVSGEYSLVKAAAEKGWIDEPRVTLEILTGIKRAGADLILTYHARDAARWLAEGKEP